jgi:hypothetical protein
MSVCSPCIWLQSIEQPQALFVGEHNYRTVIWLFKVIDMCTPWSLETRPRSKILAKTLEESCIESLVYYSTPYFRDAEQN